MWFKQKKKEYVVITEASTAGLTEVVSMKIAEGWSPIGGMSFSVIKIVGNQYDYKLKEKYCQAMTR